MDGAVAFGIEINSMSGIAFTTTAAKARWIAVSSYWEAGYGRKGLWPSVQAWREPRLDGRASNITDFKKVYAEEYLP